MSSWYGAALLESSRLARSLGTVLFLLYLPAALTLTLIHFPYDTDSPAGSSSSTARKPENFYEAAYQTRSGEKRGFDYEKVARAAAEMFGIEPEVRQFARDYRLENKRVLEVGSGRGYLQDIVADYTGLDLSSQVARFYHKMFVTGSATAMPFSDSSFDAIWTIWVLEHIPEPERALTEMRRVLKPGGLLYLAPAWNCTPWAADGLEVRPYSDFNWRGKVVKASLPIQSFPLLQAMHVFPIRGIRWAQYRLGDGTTPLRFRALEPNYDTYWQPDSDAAVSLDRFETYLWFRSRGDECLNCDGPSEMFTEFQKALVIRISKKPSSRA